MPLIPVKRSLLDACALFAVLFVAGPARAQAPQGRPDAAVSHDWPQFLGPDRNGISRETGLLKSWPDGGPKEIWRVPGGQGMSGLTIVSGRLYTLVQKDEKQWAICLDARTGKSLWERDFADAYRNMMGDGPRATPAVARETVFVFSGDGVLAALRTDDGKVLWKKDVVSELGGKPADYGMVCSPLILGDRVIVTVGANQATVAAFDCKTGKLAWRAGENHPAGYSSPALLNVGGREQVVAFHGDGAFGLDPETGAELWSFPYVTDFNCNIATPLAIDGQVFISSGENHGSVLLALKSQGEMYDVTEVWSSQGVKSVLRNEWQTSILLDGHLYGFDNVGSAGPVSHLTCIDSATGKRDWQQPRFGKGNLIAADGKLFVTTIEGDLVVLAANSKRFEELGRKRVVGKTRQAPALANGLVYVRDERDIVCVDVRAK